MLFEAQRRVGWVTFDASWTWAHAMSNFTNLENPYDPNHWNRDFYPKHRVVLNSLWQLPFGKGSRFLSHAPRAVDGVIGGWKLAWVGIVQTGQYFTPSFSGADPSGTNTSGGLPDRIANGNLPTEQRSLARWFDTSAFVRPPTGRFGNSGVNVLQGPGEVVHNVSLSKRFMITERLHLDFMSMVSNLLNHPNFNFPASNISAPGQAGVITSQHGFFTDDKSGARLVEMRVRLEF
jgi:hypothetical protein